MSVAAPSGLPAPTVAGAPPPRTAWFSPFALSFAVLGIGTAASLVLSMSEQNLNVYRAKFSIWVSLLLAGPALCLYALGLLSEARWRAWKWFWTFSLLAYWVHFYFAMRAFHWSIGDVYQKQNSLVATTNFAVTGLWTLDVLLAWLNPMPPGRPWQALVVGERFLTALLTFIAFFTATVVFKQGFVHYLGLTVTIAIAACLLYRGANALFGGPPATSIGPTTSTGS